MACKCYIVPPHLLQGIADSKKNSEKIREVAKFSYESHNRICTARKERMAALAQPDPKNRRTHHPRPFVPQQVFQRLAESENVDETTRARAKRDLEKTQELLSRSQDSQQTVDAKESAYRAVYDMQHSSDEGKLPGELVRAEGEAAVQDNAVNEAFDNVGIVLEFYKELFSWNSIDNKNADVISSVHFGEQFENACKNSSRHVVVLESTDSG